MTRSFCNGGLPGALSENPLFREVTNPVAFAAKISGLYEVLGTISPEGTGWTAIQLETLQSGGISGGPALDSLGNMVGIATFGVVDPESGGTIRDCISGTHRRNTGISRKCQH